ncbi:hypothetical protein SDC9_74319 [bioreactor metagenome]|uniref:Uncharacterized protein n=1 Tax=bioreactor metagenome TaxID=1076179 RepID=A0A644YGV9_9ZZZZ
MVFQINIVYADKRCIIEYFTFGIVARFCEYGYADCFRFKFRNHAAHTIDGASTFEEIIDDQNFGTAGQTAFGQFHFFYSI